MAERVVLPRLNGMAKSMAVVQRLASNRAVCADAGFTQVSGDSVGLDGDTLGDKFGENLAFDVKHCPGCRFDESEDCRVGDETAFDDFSEPAANLGRRQGPQRIEVTQNASWLVKGADQVLAFAGIDSRLPADCCIDHAEHRSG